MLKIEGKTFMNIQEAVQWLLDNNALPFQSSANYIANTEIGLGTVVNPSPAKVRIGSLIFFADSKVSTVTGLTENGFIVSDQYNDLVDDVVYVSNVAINASGHLIVTLSNGNNIDAGLIKQVTGLSINASQHLIANYNDGTNTDLGAIFNGNITISGNLSVGGDITGNSIIENMTGYSFQVGSDANYTYDVVYAGSVKNGNKLTLVLALNLTKLAGAATSCTLGRFTIPSAVGLKIIPTRVGSYDFADNKVLNAFLNNASYVNVPAYITKSYETILNMAIGDTTNMVEGNKYYTRYEVTFLLSDSLN